jgi:signal peptidase II
MAVQPDRVPGHRARTLTVMLGIAVAVVTADAVSKAVALRDLHGRPPVRLLDGLLTLTLKLNPGAAFGVGTSYTVVIALIACGVVVYVIRMAVRLRSLAWTIGLGLLLGGAAGNLADRLFRPPGPFRGSVVDWLNLPHFPWTFNLADAAITCAAVLICVLTLLRIPATGRSPSAPSAPQASAAPTGPAAGHDRNPTDATSMLPPPHRCHIDGPAVARDGPADRHVWLTSSLSPQGSAHARDNRWQIWRRSLLGYR